MHIPDEYLPLSVTILRTSPLESSCCVPEMAWAWPIIAALPDVVDAFVLLRRIVGKRVTNEALCLYLSDDEQTK